jgi:SAM-dependent methyltransferase
VTETLMACPLCEEGDGRRLESIPYSSIWSALESRQGVKLEAPIVERHTPAPATELRECSSCGLRYFAPSRPGDADFYAAIGASGYYEPDRWEFGVVRASVAASDDVLDIGCGQGDFLRSIKDRPGRTVGVDHNPLAIERLQSLGIEGYAADLAQLANVESESFDVVCAFQILEHVPSADTLVRSALALLRPGGRLLISVPNRDRYMREGLEPLDHPPHHLSRWSERQFTALARRYGLELTGVSFEEPDFAAAEIYWFEGMRRRVGRLLGARAGMLAARAARRYWISPARYEHAAAARHFTSRGICGHTLLAELRRPASTGPANDEMQDDGATLGAENASGDMRNPG